MRRRKYVKKLEDVGFAVPVFVHYDMEEKQLQLTYPDYSDDSDDSDDDDEVPTNQPVAGGEFQDGSLEHPVDLTGEDGAAPTSRPGRLIRYEAPARSPRSPVIWDTSWHSS
jgi:hypothetical protein